MQNVTVPAEFFRSELTLYPNWRDALCRELLQNSLDAGATRIDVTLSTVDGHGRIQFTDNGTGMTQATLENVFFALGRTTKTGPDTIGGFGRARILTCFAQHAYTIRTGTLVAEGQGGQYQLRHTSDQVNGCEFMIDLVDTTPDDVGRALLTLVRTSALPIPVYVNEERALTGELPARAVRVLRDADQNPWARVYRLNGGGGQLLVQVRGLVMFFRWVSGVDDIVVELTPSRAREVLAANRAHLREPFNEQLDKFVESLTTNRDRALRPDERPVTRRVSGGGFLTSTPTIRTRGGDALAGDPQPLATGEPVGTGESGSMVNLGDAPRAGVQRTGRTISRGAVPGVDLTGLGFDVFLCGESSDGRRWARAARWDPARWGTKAGRRRKLILMWKTAVETALGALLTVRPSVGAVSWSVGFVFDPYVRAQHRSHRRGHVLLVNPVDDDGRLIYSTSSRSDRRTLLALAMHEVAHVVVSQHDEEFAVLLTSLYAAVDHAAADRAMRGV